MLTCSYPFIANIGLLDKQLHVGTLSPDERRWGKYGKGNKPQGGLWTSTYIPKYGSDWVGWLYREEWWVPDGDTWNSYIIYPTNEARIYHIEDKKTWEFLIDRYEGINWDKMAKEYDAVHLTLEGLQQNRWEPLYPNPSTWDVESTCWFRPAFTVKHLGNKRWRR